MKTSQPPSYCIALLHTTSFSKALTWFLLMPFKPLSSPHIYHRYGDEIFFFFHVSLLTGSHLYAELWLCFFLSLFLDWESQFLPALISVGPWAFKLQSYRLSTVGAEKTHFLTVNIPLGLRPYWHWKKYSICHAGCMSFWTSLFAFVLSQSLRTRHCSLLFRDQTYHPNPQI